jgi:DNA-binding transcriptional ArsR family regulator
MTHILLVGVYMQIVKEISLDEFKLLTDPTRKNIISLITSDELSVSQIATKLGLTPPTVYHHIKKMLEAGLVRISNEERVFGHLIESYYRASADVFTSSIGHSSVSQSNIDIRRVLQALEESGFILSNEEELVSRLTELEKIPAEEINSKELVAVMNSFKNYDLVTRQRLKQYVHLWSMSGHQFREYIKRVKQIRELLKSYCTFKGN